MKATGGRVTVAGATHPLQIVVRDSQSNPNRAAEVDIVTACATPETVNPVADQCELAGIPCLSNDAPLEPYFFGRGGDPKKGFEWTYHVFFSATNLAEEYFSSWDQVATNKTIGALWPNDNDGQAFSERIRAVADDPRAADLIGLSTERVYPLAMGIVAITMLVAACCMSVWTNFDPAIGPSRLLAAFEAVVLGSLGSLWGTLVGGIMIGVAQNVGAQFDASWQGLAQHLVFLVVLILRPQGLFAKG